MLLRVGNHHNSVFTVVVIFIPASASNYCRRCFIIEFYIHASRRKCYRRFERSHAMPPRFRSPIRLLLIRQFVSLERNNRAVRSHRKNIRCRCRFHYAELRHLPTDHDQGWLPTDGGLPRRHVRIQILLDVDDGVERHRQRPFEFRCPETFHRHRQRDSDGIRDQLPIDCCIFSHLQNQESRRLGNCFRHDTSSHKFRRHVSFEHSAHRRKLVHPFDDVSSANYSSEYLSVGCRPNRFLSHRRKYGHVREHGE